MLREGQHSAAIFVSQQLRLETIGYYLLTIRGGDFEYGQGLGGME